MPICSQISLNTPPGTKIQLIGRIPIRQGYLQVGPHNVKVLGGSVLKLLEKWEANRLVEITGRVYTGQVGAMYVQFVLSSLWSGTAGCWDIYRQQRNIR